MLRRSDEEAALMSPRHLIGGLAPWHGIIDLRTK